MKSGKIAESVLKRSVLKQFHKVRKDVEIGASLAEDSAAVTTEGANYMTFSTDPVFGDLEDPRGLAQRAVLRAVNNLAATGAEPVGIMSTVLFPTAANEPQLRRLMEELQKACEAFQLQILGGHTEISKTVSVPVVIATGVGKSKRVIPTGNAKAGMDIIVTKWIGLQGTMEVLKIKEQELSQHFTRPFLDKVQELEVFLPIVSEAAVAVSSGVSAMHDVSEGGIFAALWDMAEASGVGLEIDLKKIPIRQETVEICEYVGVNPYKLLSAGCLLMAAEDGNHVVREMEKAGISATIIGKATDGNDRVLINEDERRFLETPQTDEIYSLK